MAQQFNEITYDIAINPFSLLKATEFIKENSIASSEGKIGNWRWRTIMLKDGSIIGWSHGNTALSGSCLTLFN